MIAERVSRPHGALRHLCVTVAWPNRCPPPPLLPPPHTYHSDERDMAELLEVLLPLVGVGVVVTGVVLGRSERSGRSRSSSHGWDLGRRPSTALNTNSRTLHYGSAVQKLVRRKLTTITE